MKRAIRRWGIRLALFCVAVGVLALASFMSQEDWDGRFPVGEFRLSIKDENGVPIPGALVRGYFEDRSVSDKSIRSDANGQIVLTQPHSGFQFGGTRWNLFWFIPMGDQPPEYIWEVTADGFEPHRIGWEEVNTAPRSKKHPTVTNTSGTRHVELPVFDVTVTLKR